MNRFLKNSMIAASLLCMSSQLSFSQDQKYSEDWESLKNYKAPEWYEDAKFGYWVHWGVYSVPAFGGDHAAEWYGRWMYSQTYQSSNIGAKFMAHHKEKYGDPSEFGYKDFIPMFKAENFDANEWAQLFKEGGAKYFTMMGSHHDSFCMWDSDKTKWNAADMGPKRDLVGEISKAVRDNGLKFGVSNHLGWNYMFFIWNHVNKFDYKKAKGLYGNPDILRRLDTIKYVQGQNRHKDWLPKFAPYVKPSKKDFKKWTNLTTELCDKYKPDLYYFDWGFNIPEYEAKRKYFGAHYYNKAIEWGKGTYGDPNVVLNYKSGAFPAGSAVNDHERGSSNVIQPMVWQTDDCVYSGNNWGYAEGMKIKSVNTIVDQLIDIVSKRGVLMLSLAPKPDGTFPEDQKQFMREMGAWLKVCGEAIYSTRPWNTNREYCVKDNGKKPVNMRFTRSKDSKKIYAIMLDWTYDKFTIENMKSYKAEDIKSVSLIGSNAPVKWMLDEKGMHIALDVKPSYDNAYPLRIELK